MKGVFTALLTPFLNDGTVDEQALRQMVRHNIDEMAIDGLYIGGSTGEAFLMNETERIKVLKIVKDEAKEAITLIAQIGSLNLEESIRIGKVAKSLGYQAVSAITPYYYRFSFEEILAFYNDLCQAVQHPMIVYSNPSMSGSNFDLGKYEQLLNLEYVIGVKYSDADVAKFERLTAYFKDKLFYYGYDEISIVGFMLGADGVIGSTYNMTGHIVKKMVGLLENGDLVKARNLQGQVTNCIESIVGNNLYPTLKGLLSLVGVNSSFMKKPFGELNDHQKGQLDVILSEIQGLDDFVKSQQ
jgi:N-acetylneuraminate lyase